MEYIESEPAKDKERNLWHNPKCDQGKDGNRKVLGFKGEIVQTDQEKGSGHFAPHRARTADQ